MLAQLYGPVGPVARRWEVPKFARARKIRSHAPRVPMPRQAGKEDAQVAMTLFCLGTEKLLSFIGSSYHLLTNFVTEVLSWLTAEGSRPSRSSNLLFMIESAQH